MANETQNNAIKSMLLWSEYFAKNRETFYEASKEGSAAAWHKALDNALGSAQLAIRFCEDAGFEPRLVMETTVSFLETFGTEEYANLIKASA